MRYEVVIDDPGAYTAVWTGQFDLRWEPDLELFEYVCQQANRATQLMTATSTGGGRTAPVVP